jgi:hypothetical protein
MFKLDECLLCLKFYLPDLFDRLMLEQEPCAVPDGQEVAEFLHCTKERAAEIMTKPETQLFMYNLVLMKLIDDGDNASAKDFGDFIFARLNNVNLRTLDHLGAKAMYMISVANEKMGELKNIRATMFDCHKTACLRKDMIGQATITNVILRSYLSQNLYEQARQFIVKTNFPINASNN